MQRCCVQGVADDGTPPRDTYSQSTDPSNDEHTVGVDTYDAAGPSSRAQNSQDRSQEQTEEVDQQDSHEHDSLPKSQAADQHESLRVQPSVTLDTEYDPGEDPTMQEGWWTSYQHAVLCILFSKGCNGILHRVSIAHQLVLVLKFWSMQLTLQARMHAGCCQYVLGMHVDG